MSHLKFVFDPFPDHNGCLFIEVEDEQGKSLRAGEWRERQDGLVELVVIVGPEFVPLSNELCPDCGHDNVLCACGYKL
ncbi:hypothetical protein AH02_34 [Pseudomonas phage AH02]|nr:hypothetical protein AH02_34 [Pseudomonas phage AH02]